MGPRLALPSPKSSPGLPGKVAPGCLEKWPRAGWKSGPKTVDPLAQIRPPSKAGQEWLQRAIFNCKTAAFGRLAAQGRFGPKSGLRAKPARNGSRGPFSIAKRPLLAALPPRAASGPNPASEPCRPEMAPEGHFQLQKGRFWLPCRPGPFRAQIRPPSQAGQK